MMFAGVYLRIYLAKRKYIQRKTERKAIEIDGRYASQMLEGYKPHPIDGNADVALGQNGSLMAYTTNGETPIRNLNHNIDKVLTWILYTSRPALAEIEKAYKIAHAKL